VLDWLIFWKKGCGTLIQFFLSSLVEITGRTQWTNKQLVNRELTTFRKIFQLTTSIPILRSNSDFVLAYEIWLSPNTSLQFVIRSWRAGVLVLNDVKLSKNLNSFRPINVSDGIKFTSSHSPTFACSNSMSFLENCQPPCLP